MLDLPAVQDEQYVTRRELAGLLGVPRAQTRLGATAATRSRSASSGNAGSPTRHYAGWYMTDVLELRAEDVAVALGHTDGGDEVRCTYGHADDRIALRRVANAYESVGSVVPIRKDMA